MTMKIIKVIARECGDLEKQYRRHFKPKLGGDVLDELEDAVRDMGSLSAIETALGDVAGRVIVPSNDCELGELAGIRSWRDRRFRVVIDVEVRPFTARNNTCERMIVIGYCDRAEITRNDEIEPDTEIFINSIVRLSGNIRRRHGVDVESYRVIEDSSILCGHDELSFDDDRMEISLTPYNIFEALVANAEEEDEFDDEDDDIVLSSSILSVEAKSVKRRNNHSTNYMSDLIRADVYGRTAAEQDDDDGLLMRPNRSSHARESVVDADIRKNDFIRALANEIDDMYDTKNSFRYEDLTLFTDNNLEELDDITEVYLMADADDDLESDSWKSARPETMAAYQVVHAIPTIAIETLHEDIEFIIDNDSIDGRTQVFIPNSSTYVEDSAGDPIDLPDECINRFESRLIKEVFEPLTRRNRRLVDMHVKCNIFGVTRVEISIDGETTRPYVFASFADAMNSPVVSGNTRALRDFARDYSRIRQTVDGVLFDSADQDLERESRSRSSRSNRRRGSALDDIVID